MIIDLKELNVQTDKTSSALMVAPFDVTKFNGFSFMLLNKRDGDKETVIAMTK